MRNAAPRCRQGLRRDGVCSTGVLANSDSTVGFGQLNGVLHGKYLVADLAAAGHQVLVAGVGDRHLDRGEKRQAQALPHPLLACRVVAEGQEELVVPSLGDHDARADLQLARGRLVVGELHARRDDLSVLSLVDHAGPDDVETPGLEVRERSPEGRTVQRGYSEAGHF
jgi:hypothetical protein